MVYKVTRGNFGGDKYVHYFDCGCGFTVVQTYLNMLSVACANDTSVKLLKIR